MTLLIIAGIIVLVLAPLRRAFFAAWRVTIPLVIGIVAGLWFIGFVANLGGPGWIVLFVAFILVMEVAVTGKEWLEEHFGHRKD